MRAARLTTNLLLSAAVSAVLLLLLWRLVAAGDGQAPALMPTLRDTTVAGLVGYAFLSLLQAWIRAIRFRVLIDVDPAERAPGPWPMLLVTLIRNMAVDMLPARLGELSYVAMMNRAHRVRADVCVSSLGISFVFDFVALIVVLLALALLQTLTGQFELAVLHLLIVLSVIVAIMMGLLFFGIGPLTALARRLLGRLAGAPVIRPVLAFVDRLGAAIATARRGGILWRVLGLSLGVRLAKYTSLYLLFRGVTATAFPELHQASPPRILFGLIGGEAGAGLAIPTLMGFGTYEAGSVAALAWMGYAASATAVVMLALHIWSQIVDYTLGGLALMMFTFATRSKAAGRPDGWISLKLIVTGFVLALFCVGTGFMGWQWRKARKAGAAQAPPAGAEVDPSPEAEQALRAGTRDLRGFIVWSSNRGGNHDLYSLSLPHRKLRQLTDHPHVDYYARISPDGDRIVFARSREPWVSQRDERSWDVYLLDLESKRESLIARHGNVPTWSADGRSVYFQRDGGQVVAHELATRLERVVFSAAMADLPDGTHLQTPSVSASGERLAVTLRGRKRGTVLIDDAGDARKLGGGCQFTWGPRDAFLFYIDDGGRKKNQVYLVDPATLKRKAWLDLPGDYTHEYFPRVSGDATHMVLGACSEGHEHDTADYEIFLWRLNAPPESAMRITYHTGNDCWPDIYLE